MTERDDRINEVIADIFANGYAYGHQAGRLRERRIDPDDGDAAQEHHEEVAQYHTESNKAKYMLRDEFREEINEIFGGEG